MTGALLSRLPGVVARALNGAGVMEDGEITRPGVRVADGRGGFTAGAGVDYPCKLLIADYSDVLRSLANGAIGIRDRRAIVIADELSITPTVSDLVSALGETWAVIAVKRDPASAAYELQIRPS